jgi:hypothetical protein
MRVSHWNPIVCSRCILSIIFFLLHSLNVNAFRRWGASERVSYQYRPFKRIFPIVLRETLHKTFLNGGSFANLSQIPFRSVADTVDEMSSLRDSFLRNDSRLFSRALSSYYRDIHRELSSKEKDEISEMALSLSKSEMSDKLDVARLLKHLGYCGLSVYDPKDSTTLREMKMIYLSKKNTVYLDVIPFLTAFSKLNFLWEKEDEKDDILLLIEYESSKKMPEGNFAEFLTAIAKMKISWNSLSLACQENITKKIVAIKHLSEKSACAMVYAIPSLVDFNVKKIPEVLTAFLRVVEISLKSRERTELGFQVIIRFFFFGFTPTS